MIASIAILTAQITGLFLLSRRLSNALFRVLWGIVRSRTVAVSLITALLFPGTVLHELSHLFTAELLGVPTGKLTLEPQSIQGETIETGSVTFRKTDPFRRSLIGLAPFFVGLSVLFVLASIFPTVRDQTVAAFNAGNPASTHAPYLLAALLYGMFCVSLTMFASPQDMKGVIPVMLTIGIVFGALWLVGVRIHPPESWLTGIQSGLSGINGSLSVVLLLDCALYALSSAAIWLQGKR